MRRPVRFLLVLLLAAVLVGTASTIVATGLRLVAPYPATLGAPPEGLAGAQSISFSSLSGSILRGWFLPPARPGGGGVVLAHGYRETRGMFVRRAVYLHQQGFGVLLFDFQAEGESPGAHITLGGLEGLDLKAAVDELRRRSPGERIAALGVSMGGAAIVLALKPLAIDAAVIESTFPNVDSAVRNRISASLPGPLAPMLTPFLAPVLEVMMRPILGYGPEDLRPIDHIAAIDAPLLLIAGTADQRTPIIEANDLFAHAAEPKRFWAVPGAGHVDMEKFAPVDYWGHVLPFLVTNLQR